MQIHVGSSGPVAYDSPNHAPTCVSAAPWHMLCVSLCAVTDCRFSVKMRNFEECQSRNPSVDHLSPHTQLHTIAHMPSSTWMRDR